MKKIDRIYSRHERNGKYYLIARIKMNYNRLRGYKHGGKKY